MPLATLRTRRGTSAQWLAANPILGLGELGWETDLKQGKFGDGATAYNSLPYMIGGPGATLYPSPGRDLGLSLLPADPVAANGTMQPTAGVGLVARAVANQTGPTVSVVLNVATAGSALTNTFLAVYDSTGVRLGVSANLSTSLQSTGGKILTISSAALVAGGVYYIFLVIGGATTQPVLRAFPANGVPNIGNVNRFFTYSTGLTAAPSPLVLGTLAPVITAFPALGAV